MRISPKMINWLEILKTTKPPKEGEPESPGFFLAPYMEYPPMNKKLRYVMQWHIRGRSVHTDWRMEANDHLVGWTVLTPGGVPETTHTVEKAKEMIKKVGIEFNKNNKNKGFRAETKARQPKVWLTVEGVVKPGQVGATKEHPGVFVIVDKGQVYFGCFPIGQKIVANPTLKPIEHIEPGDLVLGKEGKFVKVKNKFFRMYHGYLYRIVPHNLMPFKVTDEHPILVKRSYRECHHGLSHYCFDKCYCLKHGCKHPVETREEWIEASRVDPRRDKLVVPKLKGDLKLPTDLCKLIGFFIGDGYASNYTVAFYFNRLKRQDRETLRELYKILEKWGQPRARTRQNAIELYVCSKRLATFFRQFYKEGKKYIPSWIFKLDKECIKEIFEYWYKADGYLAKNRTKRIAIYNPTLLEQATILALAFCIPTVHPNGITLAEHSKTWTDAGEKYYVSIAGIRKEPWSGIVYNLETEDHSILTPAITHNCQKPYFHEYFLKSDSKDMPFGGNDWTRVVVRAVNVQVIDPETKRPKPGTELMWRVMVPSDQEPYALGRGMEKKWVPPKDYIPIPPEWRKGEKYEKWLAWVKEQWKKGAKSEEEEESKQAKFAVGYLSYMGQIVVRGIPNQRWFLRIKIGDKVYSWICDYDVTRFSPLPLEYEGVVDKKWFDYEGDVPPNTKYNPSKTLTGKMYVIDEGTCIVDEKTEDGIDVWDVDFNGQHLKGKVRITQEEEKSPIYTFERLSQETMQLEEAKFVLQEHEIETPEGLKKHWDIRISKGFEFNIWGNPLDLKEEGQGVRALYKICRQIEKWMAIKEPKTKMMVGDLVTYVTPVDEGTVNLIDVTPPRFISMEFNGKKLKGYFVYIERDGQGFFERAKVPHPLAGTGDPAKGDFFKPFNVIKKQGWDYYWLEIYDHKAFSRCEPSYKEYLPDLEVPKQILDILVCLYPRPGTIHGARVSRVKVSDEWTVEEATRWIKKNKLHTWQGEQIRKRHSLEDEMLKKIIEEELEKRKKTPEEKQLELELKKKKLELIEKWLKTQEE